MGTYTRKAKRKKKLTEGQEKRIKAQKEKINKLKNHVTDFSMQI